MSSVLLLASLLAASTAELPKFKPPDWLSKPSILSKLNKRSVKSNGIKSSEKLFDAEELSQARRLRNEWGRPPSDKKCTQICDTEEVRCWRWSGRDGIDEYCLECEIPVAVESYFAMVSEVSGRAKWDETTRHIEVLQAGGPSALRAFHGQPGDSHTLLWQVVTPSMLRDREYVMHRRVGAVAASGKGGAMRFAPRRGSGCGFLRIDVADDTAASWALQPKVARGCSRVIDQHCIQVAWEVDGVTRVRSLYREDPMMSPLPRWIISLVLDRALPKGLESLREAAVAHEKRNQKGRMRGWRRAKEVKGEV